MSSISEVIKEKKINAHELQNFRGRESGEQSSEWGISGTLKGQGAQPTGSVQREDQGIEGHDFLPDRSEKKEGGYE